MWNLLCYINYHRICYVFIFFLLINGDPDYKQRRRKTSNTCKNHSECPMNAICEFNTVSTENGQCICNEGYLIAMDNKTSECFKVAQHLGDPCSFDEQCMFRLSTEAECKDDICQCRDGTHFVQKENACYKSVKVGDFCRLTNNCIGEGTVCRSGFCNCPIETHANEYLTGCLKDVQLGNLCTMDKECIALHSRCHDVCRCKVSHVISLDGLRCIKIAEKISDECEEDIQCQAHIPYAKCGDNNTCVCKDDYHELNYQCWVSVPLRGICEANENCALVPDTICLDGYCECKEGLQQAHGQCSGSSSSHQVIIFNIISIFIIILVFNIYIYN